MQVLTQALISNLTALALFLAIFVSFAFPARTHLSASSSGNLHSPCSFSSSPHGLPCSP